jgi:hemerythrin-like domain-containing protein
MSRTNRHPPFAAAAGFDDPLETLLGCHRRIQKQLALLKALAADVDAQGASAEASAAASALLDYFSRAAVHHHMDEERDLFPLLESRITDAGEQARFRAFRETLREDHRRLEAAWSRLRRPLQALADGHHRKLEGADVDEFVSAYAQHILAEEQSLAEFFNRWLDEGDRKALGMAMAARRGAAPPGGGGLHGA